MTPAVKNAPFSITQGEINRFKETFPAHYDLLLQSVKDGDFRIVPDEQVSRA